MATFFCLELNFLFHLKKPIMKLLFNSALLLSFPLVGIASFFLGMYFYDYESKYLAGILSFIIAPLIISLGIASIFNSWYQKFNPKASLHILNPFYITPVIAFWAFIIWGNKIGANEYLNCKLFGEIYSEISITDTSKINTKGYASFEDIYVNKNQFGYYRNDIKRKEGGVSTTTIESIVFPIFPLGGTLQKVKYFAVIEYSDLNKLFEIENFEIALINKSKIGGSIESNQHKIDNYKLAVKDFEKNHSFQVDENPVFINPSNLSLDDYLSTKFNSLIIVLTTIALVYIVLGAFAIKFMVKKHF